MNKTKIDWADYTVNPIKGKCLHACRYCYAHRIYDRFKLDPEIRFLPAELEKIKTIKRRSRIFMCSTHDLFGEWVHETWINRILNITTLCPKHTYIFLTKNPIRCIDFNFPGNCWLGTTITGLYGDSQRNILGTGPYRCKLFISFEPLLADPGIGLLGYDWIIIGAMTGPGSKEQQPKPEWIRNILKEADKHRIPVFMKDNLKGIWKGKLRREWPR